MNPRQHDLRSIPTATGGIARLACARLREHGKDLTGLLARAGLAPHDVNDPAVRLEARSQIKLLEQAAEELDDDLLGFHLGRGFDLREIGLVYYVMASSERLDDALRNAERYSLVMNEGVRLHVGQADRSFVIGIEYVNVDRFSDRQQIEFWLVALVRICRQVTDTRLAPRRIRMRHQRNLVPAEFKAFYGSEVEFGAGADEIVFSTPVSALPVIGRDDYLNNLLQQYAKQALDCRPRPRAGTRLAVESVLPRLLPHGRAGAASVARELGMSSRTLSRKLRAEGVAFAEILDELRAALAKRYLSDQELPVSEVAWLLGYREVSSFSHAFRRWTGLTPGRFRGVSKVHREGGKRAPVS